MEKYPHQIGVGGLVLTDCEKKLVNQVLDSGRLTYGPMTKTFEEGFAARHGCKHALFLNSGTSALHLALQAMKVRYGWSDGDEVIVPAVTFVATSNIVLHNNMVPVFVDVEAETFNIDPNKIEGKITNRTRAIIPVHLLGLPATMGPIMALAEKHGLKVIEDSCETMFARYNGQLVGSIGDVGTFSTYVAHFLVTGVGGFCTTNNPELADDIRSLMNHGRDTIYISCTDDQNVTESMLEKIVARRFSFVQVGHSFRCTEMEAAIGIGQLARADEIIRRRKEIADKFTSRLARFSGEIQLPTCPPDRTHSYMLYGVTVRNDTKVKLVNHLESLNIETRDLLPLINQPIYRRLYGDDLEDRFPVARRINHSSFYLGCHPYMTEEEVDFVIDAFGDYFRHNR
ncbi:MAG TPA: DegT/DnrJ/EryC1/StrS family aminotransferase [Terriglobia bacterium]